jgi:hypothetical protein
MFIVVVVVVAVEVSVVLIVTAVVFIQFLLMCIPEQPGGKLNDSTNTQLRIRTSVRT